MQENLRIIDRLIEQRDIKKAEAQIAKSLRATLPVLERIELLIRRSRTRLLAGRPDDALSDLMEIKACDPHIYESDGLQELVADSYFARFELASVGFADRNDAQVALGIYQRLLSQSPDYENTGWIQYQMGRVQMTGGEIEGAVSSFQAALLSPSHVRGLTAYCYERLGFVAFYDWRSLDKALTFLNKAADTYPAEEDRVWLIQVQALRSRVMREMHNFEAATQAAQMAVEIANTAGMDGRKSLSEALLTLAELLAVIDGHEKEIIVHLQRFLQSAKKPLGVDVTWSRVYEMLGDAHFKLGQYTDAQAAYRATLQFNPDHPWELSLHYRVACCYYQQKAYEGVIAELSPLVNALTVDDYRVYDVLGNAQFALGRYNEALVMYQTALQLIPPNTEDKSKIQTYHDFARHLSSNPSSGESFQQDLRGNN